MSNFIKFRDAVNAQIKTMEDSKSGLFLTHVNRSEIWETYLGAFPEGSDPIYMENTVHNCNCCKDFIRDLGRAVTINENNEVVTAWDIEIDDEVYQTVADALASYVRKQEIASVYKASTLGLDRKENYSLDESKLGLFSHFYYKLSNKYKASDSANELMGLSRNSFNVFKRGLTELTVSSLELISDMIGANSLYRGSEYEKRVGEFLALKKEFDKLDRSEEANFVWRNLDKHESVVLFRNSVIGSLAIDLSSGMDLESAVNAFEKKVAPDNYKRSQAVVTKKMVLDAQAKVAELGIEDSLKRRHANLGDITINNVLWADKSTKAKLEKTAFDDLLDAAPVTKKVSDSKKGETIALMDFVEKVLPLADSIKLELKGKHTGNLVTLVAPENKTAPNIMKWDNNFSWSYNGDMTDSIKARVKSKGGNVDGDARISLSWFNTDDLDIHMETPRRGRVFYGCKNGGGFSLDVDMNVSGASAKTDAVENISAKSVGGIDEGEYTVYVNNYTRRNAKNTGFDIEIDFLGEVFNFSSSTSPKNGMTVKCLTFEYSKASGFTIKDVNMVGSGSSTEVWGLNTNNYINVGSVMYSPNFWDENQVGNRHVLFMLDGCKNPEPVRGFYNEYLIESLHNHRKVFEVLGGKMKAEPVDDQLSGLGFSTTKRGDTFNVVVWSKGKQKLYTVES